MSDAYLTQLQEQRDKLQRELSRAERAIEDGNRETLKAYAQLRAANAERDRLAAGIPLICCDERHDAKVRGLEELLVAGQKATTHWEGAYAREVETHGATERALTAAVQRGDALARAVQLVANELAAAGLHDHATELCFAIDEFEALDGPAEQLAAPAQLSPASIAAPELVQPPTWAAMTEMVERARFGFLVEQLRLEAAIVTAVQDAGLTIVRTGPVEEVAAHPGTVNRLKAVVLGCFERVDASGAGPLPGPVTRMTGLPVTADHTLPPGEVHLRPHPRRCLSGWHSIPGEVCICQPHGIGEAHGCPEGCPTHNPGGPDVPDGAIGGPDTDEAADGPS